MSRAPDSPDTPPMLVCYVPGFDRRRITEAHTPFVHAQLAAHPSVAIRTQPTTELVPTMITGVYPHEHQLWQVRLQPDRPRTFLERAIDTLPDAITTTFQCVRHRLDPGFDLPTIPPRRRRRFELHRNKYLRRQKAGKSSMDSIGGVDSVFGVLGDDSRYRVITRFEAMQSIAQYAPLGDVRLDFLELYVFDLFSHWNLDQPDAIADKMRQVDDALRLLHQRCADKAVSMMFLVDHGQELVTDTVDLREALKNTGVSEDDYTFYSEVAVARFWFRTDEARDKITAALNALPNTSVFDNEGMKQFDVCFEDADGFGELYAITDHGYVFYPHDFYHPVVNWYMGHKYAEQTARIKNPLHRGYHGHLPNHPADEGFAVVFDDAVGLSNDQPAALIDVAPTMLTLLGVEPPPHMTGRVLFERRRAQPASRAA